MDILQRTTDLSFAAYGVVKDLKYDMVLLPWGATEPHNQHLPYLTDCILSHDVAAEASRKVFEKHGVRTMVLPPMSMGSQNPGQRDLHFCIHYSHSTQAAILADIVASLHHQGVRKLLIINGHGGNSFKDIIRDLSVTYPDFLIASSEWFKMAKAKDFFEEPGDHADEIETSVMMHYHPEFVNLDEAGEGKGKSFSIPAMREGKVWLPRHWNLVTEDTGIGSPMKSTAEKGKRFAEACVDAYVEFIRSFSAITDQTELYK